MRLAIAPDPRGAPAAEPAIADYAIIGDCRTAALVSRTGSIDWLCLPHFSGGSVFAALLDRERGGLFALRPTGEASSSRRYLDASPVLETTFRTASGTVRVLDLMPIVEEAGSLRPMREILRILEGVDGAVEVEARFEPRPDYTRGRARLRSRGALGWAATWRDAILLLRSDADLALAPDGRAVTGRFRVGAGERRCFSLSFTKGDIAVVPLLGASAAERLDATLRWWRRWTDACAYDGPYRAAVERSAITLRLMTFALSGAVVAAATTSLPEAIGADRNWDYRYCWLRDAALTMRAFTGLGFKAEAQAFLQWLLHATRLTWPKLQVMYDVYGRTDLEETELPHLAGHRGSRPVRVGNGAHRQVQLDVYGEVVSAAYHFVLGGGRLQADEARLLAGFGKTACRHWREPDHGIWEIRGPKRPYTFSKVMAWAALDSLLALHRRGCVTIDAEAFRRERDAIAAAIETRGYNAALGSYVSEFDGDRLDASLLLMGCIGYRHPADPRMRGTFAAIHRRLSRNGLLARYEDGYDGLAAREGAFGICSFWAVDNLAKRGDRAAARETFERLLALANDVGLYAEEIDPDTGAALGNFPQAFTHVGLINAALALAEAERAQPLGAPVNGAGLPSVGSAPP